MNNHARTPRHVRKMIEFNAKKSVRMKIQNKRNVAKETKTPVQKFKLGGWGKEETYGYQVRDLKIK